VKRFSEEYTVKKGLLFYRSQQGCHLPNSPWPGIIKLFPARESLASDIPAGDRKTANLFLQCRGKKRRGRGIAITQLTFTVIYWNDFANENQLVSLPGQPFNINFKL
jgi:hypothetical protein